MANCVRNLFIIVLATFGQQAISFNLGNNVRFRNIPSRIMRTKDGFRQSPGKPLRYKHSNEGSFEYAFTPSITPSERSCAHQSNSVNNRYSAADWLHNIQTLPKSSVLKEIRNPVLSIAIWSQFVSIAYRILQNSRSTFCNKLSRDMCIGTLPHSLLVSSLGLLLVFRTNSAYQRFAEGRKIWEQIHSVSRNISRFMNTYEEEIGSKRVMSVKKYLAAFPYLLRHHVRPRCIDPNDSSIPNKYKIKLNVHTSTEVDSRYEGDKLTIETRKGTNSCTIDSRSEPWNLFCKSALQKVIQSDNRPLWACDYMAKELTQVPYGPNFTSRERLTLISKIDKLSNAVGECERIHQTAVPLNYARHSLRSLTLWLFSLPFVMVKDLGLLTGVVMGVISWLLFGVYQIGYSIEDPFQGTLRLSILCDAMKKDILGSDFCSEINSSLNDYESPLENKDIVNDILFSKGLDFPRELGEKKLISAASVTGSYSKSIQ